MSIPSCCTSIYILYYVFAVILSGLARLPKWGHLKELHESIKLCEPILVHGHPVSISLGPHQEVLFCSECANLELSKRMWTEHRSILVGDVHADIVPSFEN